MKKILKITNNVLIIILIVLTTVGFKKNENEEVINIINNYFDNYLNSYKTLKYEENQDFIEENENTEMYLAINRVFIARYKADGLRYKNYKFKYDIAKFETKNENVFVELKLNVKYEYDNLPNNITSEINNIDYKIELKKYQDSWKIISIDTNFDEFIDFKTKVERSMTSQQRLSRKDAIKHVENTEIDKITNSKLRKNTYDNKIEDEKPMKDEINFRDLFKDKRGGCDKDLGVRYAREYAVAPENKRIFYTAKDNDCTNFVSQCVWAASGAYDPNDLEKTKENIRNGVNMIKGQWLCNFYGCTLAWANVEEFWKFCTSSSIGPKAIGSNNNKPYKEINPKSIHVGDVLQIRRKSDTRYKHSVYVTYVAPNNNDYSGIFVSQHSYDKYNRSLVDLIHSWGDEDCFIRRLEFYECK